MTDATSLPETPSERPKTSLLNLDERTQRRNKAEARFKMYGIGAICIALLALLFLLFSVVGAGKGAFSQTYITLDVELLEEKLDKNGNRDPADLRKVSTFGYAPLIKAAMEKKIADNGIEIEGLSKPDILISKEAAAQMRNFVLANPDMIGTTRTFEAEPNCRSYRMARSLRGIRDSLAVLAETSSHSSDSTSSTHKTSNCDGAFFEALVAAFQWLSPPICNLHSLTIGQDNVHFP